MRRAKRHRRREEPGLCAGRASEREERERECLLVGTGQHAKFCNKEVIN